MKNTLLFLMGTSMWMSVAAYDASAKSYRANHGIAYQSAKEDRMDVQDISPASGEPMFDKSVASGKEKVSPEAPVPKPAEEKHAVVDDKEAVPEIIPQAMPEKEADIAPTQTPESSALQTSSLDMATPEIMNENCAQDSKETLSAFYYSGAAKIEKTATEINIDTRSGTAKFGRDLYTLKRVNIAFTGDEKHPLQINLVHDFKGKPLVVSVPVVVGESPNLALALLLQNSSGNDVDVGGFVPASLEYATNCGNASVVKTINPVIVSQSQIDAFKAQ